MKRIQALSQSAGDALYLGITQVHMPQRPGVPADIGPLLGSLLPTTDQLTKATEQLYQQVFGISLAASQALEQSMRETFNAGLAQALSDVVYNTISAAFSGEGVVGVFKAFGATIFASLGSIMTQMGETLISYGIALKLALANPLNPVTAIAAGALLVALGAALGGIAQQLGGAGRGTASAGAFREPSGWNAGTGTGLSNQQSAAVGGSRQGTAVVQIHGGGIINTSDPRQRDEFVRMLRELDSTREYTLVVDR